MNKQRLRILGVVLMVTGLLLFSALPLFTAYRPDATSIARVVEDGRFDEVRDDLVDPLVGKTFTNPFAITNAVSAVIDDYNDARKKAEDWDAIIYDNPRDLAAGIASFSAIGRPAEKPLLWLVLTFGFAVLGGLLHIAANWSTKAPAGIRNDGVYHDASTSRGWVAWLVFPWLIVFYILLYFYPEVSVAWSQVSDPVSLWLSGSAGGRWFLYGLMYTTVMVVMAVRMFIKYRGVTYQVVRTASVLFFQIGFAFLIPEVLGRLNMPRHDFKNIWPLDYSFFFSWRIDDMLASGTFGMFMLVWGVVLIIVAVPVLVYFFGKRWYCSWVCGCGGLAETLGDPYRQHSDKSLGAWKIERWLVHAVLVIAAVMTAMTLYTYFSGVSRIGFIDTWHIQRGYGFLVGAVFAGVIGTGFYPIFGNRVWCRFGCPLAAYLGLVQRFKSRFRITTNGGQCISCGNCSTYCEMGIDVRWYAQRGQNIVRSSCVGCGICSAVCPRGVLRLENGSEVNRINDAPILIGKEGVQLSPNVLPSAHRK